MESEGSKHGVFYTTADGSTVEKRRRERTLLLSTSDGAQLRRVTFQVANVNKAHGSVSKMVRSGNGVVFDASGSDIENKMTNRCAMAPRMRWSIRRGHGGSTARKRTEGQTAIWEPEHVEGPVSPTERTEEHGIWDRGRAARDGRFMRRWTEDKEENTHEEIGNEEQEEEAPGSAYTCEP